MTDITHAFVSSKSDGGDTTLVRPSDWNEGHVVGAYDAADYPLFLAASNSTDRAKARALLSGGAVCDNANDETDIATADAAAAFGVVELSHGSFDIDAALTLNDGCTLTGQGAGILGVATKLNITGTSYGITLSPSGSRIGGLEKLSIYTPQNFANTALLIQNSGTDIRGYDVLHKIGIHAYASGVGETGESDMTTGSCGIKFVCTSGFNQCTYNKVVVFGYEKTMWIYVHNTSGYYYMNGNLFTDITLSSGKYLLDIDTTSTVGWNAGDFAGNQICGLILEPWWETTTMTQYGIYAHDDSGTGGYGRMYSNQITNCHIWDNDHIVQKAIYLGGNSYGNQITACFSYGRDTDLGTSNNINRIPV